MPVLTAAAALLGLAVGSFLNVVIRRVPDEGSLSTPFSPCRSCEQRAAGRLDLPVLSWLLRHGRCPSCGSPVSLRYPMVELVTCVCFTAIAIQLPRVGQLWAVPAFLYFAAMAIALSLIDAERHRLPDAIVLPSYPVLALGLTIAAVLTDAPAALVRALLGGLALFLCYSLLTWCEPSGMGPGEAKLAGLVGGMLSYLSYPTLLVGAFAGSVVGGTYATAALMSGRANRKTPVPYGPFMLGGAFVAIFAGSPLAQFYTMTLGG
ncbi:MAG: prepilin peptidase [Actinobacteria bacterium]|nr:prepilin peptidase [Actinomycetota bacterium]